MICAVQNKCDVSVDERRTSESVCEAFANEHRIRLFKTSGKTGEGIADMFI